MGQGRGLIENKVLKRTTFPFRWMLPQTYVTQAAVRGGVLPTAVRAYTLGSSAGSLLSSFQRRPNVLCSQRPSCQAPDPADRDGTGDYDHPWIAVNAGTTPARFFRGGVGGDDDEGKA